MTPTAVGAEPDLIHLLPPGTTVDADGVARVGGARLDDIAADVGTPAIIVAEDALRARARAYADGLASRWPNSRVVFASKSFPCTAVQRVMVQEGLGLDVAGGGEIVTALKAGADPASLVLHGNAKLDDEIALAVENRLGLVVVDNADDVDRLEAAIPRGQSMDVLVRVIPGVTADTHASVLTGHDGSKFGLAPAQAVPLIARIEASPVLRMRGLHLHVGSQIMETEPFAQAVEAVAGIAGLGEFPVYDLGGGLGARYTWSDQPAGIPDYLDALVGAARAHLPAQAQLIIEPGRSMVAEAACTLYRVVTVKRGTHTFVAVDGGMGDNLEAAGRSRGRRPARRPRHRRLLPHDGQQLQRQPPGPRGLRLGRQLAGRRAPRDVGRPPAPRRRLTKGESDGPHQPDRGTHRRGCQRARMPDGPGRAAARRHPGVPRALRVRGARLR